jgi:diaminohydroxyphosphoribosylaminopyrimidine deaminase/5-amino-6-(5-phosphoribosylamino)uracil reductase
LTPLHSFANSPCCPIRDQASDTRAKRESAGASLLQALAAAKESALGKLADGDPRLATATIYSALEPCSQRKSRPRTCAQLILAAGIPRVVVAWREPALFVADCQGCELLEQAGVELPEFADRAMEPNKHLAL